jgi:hypothetical protein
MSENRNAAMTMMPAVPERAGTENLQPLGVAGLSTQLWLAPFTMVRHCSATTRLPSPLDHPVLRPKAVPNAT